MAMRGLFIIAALAGCWFLTGPAPARSGEADAPFGVCAHLNRMPPAETEAEMKAMKEAGVQFFRTDLDWGQVEPEPGQWNYERWDGIVALARREGLYPLAILSGEPFTRRRIPIYPQLDRWLAFVEKTAERYKDAVFHYEVLNEVDCDAFWGEKPNPEQYADLLVKTYAVIKRVNPKATVLFSGVSDFGNPLPFVEKAFQAGAGKGFDAMSFHPYQYNVPVEARMPRRIAEVRALMNKYGIDKPLWISETGIATAPFRLDILRGVVPAALRKLGLDPATAPIGRLADPAYAYYTDAFNVKLSDYLPEAARTPEFTLDELARLEPQDCPVVALPGSEVFPLERFAAVRDYVARGGTVIIPAGLPFYVDWVRHPGGGFSRGNLGAPRLPELHIAWEAFWTNPKAPREIERFEPGAEFPELRFDKVPAMRFLTAANLKPGDAMIPLLEGVAGGYRAPVAALYRLDSDLKGNLIVVTLLPDGFTSTPEEQQAELLPRHYLTALGNGVDKLFWYRLRATERNDATEAHYGIVRRDFSPKPAARAFRALADRYPDGSSPVAFAVDGETYTAAWSRPDGTRVTAVWTLARPKAATVAFDGKLLRVDNVLGEPLAADVAGPEYAFTAKPGITYFTTDAATRLRIAAP